MDTTRATHEGSVSVAASSCFASSGIWTQPVWAMCASMTTNRSGSRWRTYLRRQANPQPAAITYTNHGFEHRACIAALRIEALLNKSES